MLCVQEYDSPDNYIIGEGAAQVWTAVGAHTRLPAQPRQAVGLRGLTRGAWVPAGGPGLLSGPRGPPGEGQGALGLRRQGGQRP